MNNSRPSAALTTQPQHFIAARSLCLAAILSVAFINARRAAVFAQETAAPASAQSPSAAMPQQQKSPRVREDKPSPAKTRPASGSITGRVVSDDGQPMANVIVRLMKRSSAMTPNNTNVPTDAEGAFRADDLDAGAYTVHVHAPGYTAVRDPGTANDEPRYYRPGDNVVVTMTKGGVITGFVRDAEGNPVVAAGVRAVYVRDLENRTPRGTRESSYYRQPSSTDDRGVYRIYGLEPGVYVVVVGGGPSEQYFGRFSLYEGNAPTYYPSATRDGATEVTVQVGQEASGIDIRYRGERGHTISGKVSGGAEAVPAFDSGISLTLTHAATGLFESTTYVYPDASNRAFSFDGVSDGDYEVVARRYTKGRESLASPPLRVVVRGANVTGMNVALAPLASISGRLTLKAMSEAERAAGACADSAPRIATPSEAIVVARREEKESDAAKARPLFPPRSDAAPDDAGEFTINGLTSGRHRLEALPPGDDWYIRSLVIPAGGTPSPPHPGTRRHAASAQATSNATRETLLTLASGQTVGGVNVTLADGAASLRGTIPADKGRPRGARMRVHLVPSERERADDALRYASSSVAVDGSFALTNLAPGRYWLLVAAAESDLPESRLHATAWDAEARSKLRRDAEAAANTIDLQPCQRINDFTLK
ncbi:MAG TPA: carboxypeptidase-like regulatory domain-containing protein [Pyrinomonadaceae bacterium]|nr:carboxypeptidase-like regulatory domain-containing protein [Pyrinomonadaceae bacterium]